VYEKAVLDLLKDGTKQRKLVIIQLCPKIMSLKKAQSTVNELEDAGRMKTVRKRVEGTHRYESWYCLPGHEFLLEVEAGRVLAAIERLWSILLRPPTSEEIAVETGITPEDAEELAYKYALQTGWFHPTPVLIHDKTERLAEILFCAAQLRDGKVREDGSSKDFDYENDREIVDEAKRFLKQHPEMLAKTDKDGRFVSWPREALKYLKKDLKPKDHHIGDLFAFKFG
jgi:hypothetical protein